MRLALQCGRPDVDRMLSELTSHELAEWIAFYNIDPFGDQRGDEQTAFLISILVNMMRAKGSAMIPINTFMLHRVEVPVKQTPLDMEKLTEGFVRKMRGK